MNICVLKRLRKEAHEMYGISYHIDNTGQKTYMVSNRLGFDSPSDRKLYTFLEDAVKALEIKRREYIIFSARSLKVEKQNRFLKDL